MKKPVLVIMAAGMGSRYGGLKQIDPIDKEGHIIMDFSIYDAKRAGFEKVVFIIKKENETDFKEAVGKRIEKVMDVAYVYQELTNIPDGFEIPKDRVKPWGTAHAVLSAIDEIDGPFAVINADDYYGKEAFVKMHDFLVNHEEDKERFRLGMAGYILKNTLSDNGTVTRGVCVVDEKSGYLEKILETHSIYADEKGKVHCEEADVAEWIHPDVNVSMNMWAGYPDFIDYLEEGFREFLAHIEDNPMKKEYLLPNIVELLLNQDKATVKVYETADRWFGVTYLEDKPFVVDSIRGLIKDGVYPENLWA